MNHQLRLDWDSPWVAPDGNYGYHQFCNVSLQCFRVFVLELSVSALRNCWYNQCFQQKIIRFAKCIERFLAHKHRIFVYRTWLRHSSGIRKLAVLSFMPNNRRFKSVSAWLFIITSLSNKVLICSDYFVVLCYK